MSRSPTVVAAFAQLHLDKIESDDVFASRVSPLAGEDTLKTIRESSRISRIPIAVHAKLNDALFEVAGETRGRAICRATALASFRQPYLEALVSGALKLLGDDPGRVSRWAPRVWEALYRNAGSMKWESRSPTTGQLVLTGAPAFLADDAHYLSGLSAGFEAIFDVTDAVGEVSVRASRSEIVMEMSWTKG